MANGPLPFDSSTKPKVYLEADHNEMCKHAFEGSAAYIIRKNGSYYEGIKKGTNTLAGNVTQGGSGDEGGATGTVAKDVITAVLDAAAGDHVHIKGGAYALTDEIVVGDANTWITGDGKATKLTQGTADKHCFKITTKADVRLSNMWLYGTGAGTGSGVYATTTCTNLTLDHLICENWGYHGIIVTSSDYPVLAYNNCTANNRFGMVLDTVTYGLITNNKLHINTRSGLWPDDSDNNLITNNIIIDNDSADSASWNGIDFTGSCNDNVIVNNTITGNDGYEIKLGTTGTGNYIGENFFDASADHDRIIYDPNFVGVYRTLQTSFDGGAAGATQIANGANGWGWEIDAGGEITSCKSRMPDNLSEIVKITIHGSALVAETHSMEVEVAAYAGADDETVNAHTISDTFNSSITTDFAINDYIKWRLSYNNAAALDDVTGKDNLLFSVLHEAAAGDDCATDATFANIVIHYV